MTRAGDHPVVEHPAADSTPNSLRGVESLACRLVSRQGDGRQEAKASHFADDVQATQALEPVQEVGPVVARLVDQPFALDDLDVFEPNGAAGRMSAVGVPM